MHWHSDLCLQARRGLPRVARRQRVGPAGQSDPVDLRPFLGQGRGKPVRLQAHHGRLDTRERAERPGFPSPEAVWYKDIGTEFTPHSVWMEAGGAITRISLARDPNWKVSNPDDVKSEWYEWEKIERVNVTSDGKPLPRYWGSDSTHLTAAEKNAYAGGMVWSEYEFVMGTPYPTPIEEYDPVRHALRIAPPFGDSPDTPGRIPRTRYKPVPHCRYYLENLPRFLDVPGEYYFTEQGPLAGRLYVRLPREQDPNGVAIEVAERPTLVDIREQSHIHVSGLTFRFQNVIALVRNFTPPCTTAPTSPRPTSPV